MSKNFQEQMADARAKRQAEFEQTQSDQNNNAQSSQTEQSHIPATNNPQPLLNLSNILAALLQPGGVQNFIQQNGGSQGIANQINQFTQQNSLPSVKPQDIDRASVLISTFDMEIEPGVKPSGEFSPHDPNKVIATKEANIRKNLANKINNEGLTIETKKSIAELSPVARDKLIEHHVTKFDKNKVELKNEVIDFIKSGCLVQDESQVKVVDESIETKQAVEKLVEVEKLEDSKNEIKAQDVNLYDKLTEAFNDTKNIDQFTGEIRLLDANEASSLIDMALNENPLLGDLVTNIYYQ